MTEVIKTPLHLWIVGVVATLWNSFGVTDYVMTRTQGSAWIDQMMPGTDSAKLMTYIDSFPIWASAGWALGVWGALAGSLLLLACSRHAVAAVMPYVIIAIAAVLLWYAQRQKAAGVLR